MPAIRSIGISEAFFITDLETNLLHPALTAGYLMGSMTYLTDRLMDPDLHQTGMNTAS